MFRELVALIEYPPAFTAACILFVAWLASGFYDREKRKHGSKEEI